MQTSNIDIRWLDRSAAMLSPMGRWWLNCDVRLQRSLWKWRTEGGDAIKRALDVVASAIFLAASSPLYLLIAVLIRLEDGGPAIFTQIRVGRFGREFKMYKFRSMRPNAEAMLSQLLVLNTHQEGITFKIKNDPRLTRLGKWLRKLSLDELPQVWNVFKGDMSLVGPRPPVPREVAKYSLADRRRLLVKPGITCFWQIGGRSDIDFSGQVKLDVKYIEDRSLWTDVKILIKTLPAVAEGKGAC
jgi:lipopolysaccharide/colanic/teichoic acid biosynthesis glycosyltransferase